MSFEREIVNRLFYENAAILPEKDEDDDTIVRSEHHPITTADKPNMEENNLPNNTNEPNNINETSEEV